MTTQTTDDFTGLGMPVFTAFGWAGEETALKYALAQLETFVQELHAELPRKVQERLPVFGMSLDTQVAFLASSEEVENDAHIVFNTRPTSFEIQLVIKDKKVLKKGLKKAEKDMAVSHRLITELGPEWNLRLQQMEIDEKSGEPLHYQDIFKDSLSEFDEETAQEVISKVAYLNGEDRWVTPIYLGRRFSAEQIAAMGVQVINVMSDYVTGLLPALQLLSGQVEKKRKRKKSKKRKTRKKKAAVKRINDQIRIQIDDDEFDYVTDLKPLHIRRGFVNLTPDHWPFFAINSRTETRPVTIYYDGVYDKDSTVWRLLPNDMARIVLSNAVHSWLEDNFSANDQLYVSAKKMDDKEIQISLRDVE